MIGVGIWDVVDERRERRERGEKILVVGCGNRTFLANVIKKG